MSEKEKPLAESSEQETARLVAGIERTRADMSGTVAALEARLSPSEIRGKVEGELSHVEEKVRQVVREQLADAKAIVHEELAEARTLLRSEMNEVEAKVRKGVRDAKDGVKAELNDAITGAKEGIRVATLGRVEDLATKTGDIMNDSRDTLVMTIRSNPIPAALAGIGIAWLFLNRSSSARRKGRGESGVDYARSGVLGGAYGGGDGGYGGAHAGGHGGGYGGYGGPNDTDDGIANGIADGAKNLGKTAGRAYDQVADRAGSLAHDASDAVGSMAHKASDVAGDAIHGAGALATSLGTQTSHAASAVVHGAEDAASFVSSGVRSQARRVEHGFHTALEDNPLALGVAAVAIGAAIGYALPRTRGEDALMGHARDEMLHRVGESTHDAVHLVGQMAERSVETAKGLLSEAGSPASASK